MFILSDWPVLVLEVFLAPRFFALFFCFGQSFAVSDPDIDPE